MVTAFPVGGPADGGVVDDQSAYGAFLKLARVVRREHTAGADGWCVACTPRQPSPCPPLSTTSEAFPFRMAELWAQPDTLTVLAARDIAGLFRLLQRRGISQRRIAECTQQSQSEVCEILNGRRVESYSVLARIAEGLVIPRGYMGLAYTAPPATLSVEDPARESDV